MAFILHLAQALEILILSASSDYYIIPCFIGEIVGAVVSIMHAYMFEIALMIYSIRSVKHTCCVCIFRYSVYVVVYVLQVIIAICSFKRVNFQIFYRVH